MNLKKTDIDEDGNEVIRYFCCKCNKFRKRNKYAPDDELRIQICSDCYANDYKDDIVEIFGLYEKLLEFRKIPKNELMKIMGDDFDQINRLFERMDIGYSDDDIVEEVAVKDSDFFC